MLLTSATTNKSLELLDKLGDGRFGLDVNALKRHAFVDGDALSCIPHANSKLVMAKTQFAAEVAGITKRSGSRA